MRCLLSIGIILFGELTRCSSQAAVDAAANNTTCDIVAGEGDCGRTINDRLSTADYLLSTNNGSLYCASNNATNSNITTSWATSNENMNISASWPAVDILGVYSNNATGPSSEGKDGHLHHHSQQRKKIVYEEINITKKTTTSELISDLHADIVRHLFRGEAGDDKRGIKNSDNYISSLPRWEALGMRLKRRRLTIGAELGVQGGKFSEKLLDVWNSDDTTHDNINSRDSSCCAESDAIINSRYLNDDGKYSMGIRGLEKLDRDFINQYDSVGRRFLVEKYVLVDTWTSQNYLAAVNSGDDNDEPTQNTNYYMDSSNVEDAKHKRLFDQALDRLVKYRNVEDDSANDNDSDNSNTTTDSRSIVEVCRGFTTHCSGLFEDNSFDFIYVDARHDYKGVFEDLEHWWPKLRKTFDWEGLRKVLDHIALSVVENDDAAVLEYILLENDNPSSSGVLLTDSKHHDQLLEEAVLHAAFVGGETNRNIDVEEENIESKNVKDEDIIIAILLFAMRNVIQQSFSLSNSNNNAQDDKSVSSSVLSSFLRNLKGSSIMAGHDYLSGYEQRQMAPQDVYEKNSVDETWDLTGRCVKGAVQDFFGLLGLEIQVIDVYLPWKSWMVDLQPLVYDDYIRNAENFFRGYLAGDDDTNEKDTSVPSSINKRSLLKQFVDRVLAVLRRKRKTDNTGGIRVKNPIINTEFDTSLINEENSNNIGAKHTILFNSRNYRLNSNINNPQKRVIHLFYFTPAAELGFGNEKGEFEFMFHEKAEMREKIATLETMHPDWSIVVWTNELVFKEFAMRPKILGAKRGKNSIDIDSSNANNNDTADNSDDGDPIDEEGDDIIFQFLLSRTFHCDTNSEYYVACLDHWAQKFERNSRESLFETRNHRQKTIKNEKIINNDNDEISTSSNTRFCDKDQQCDNNHSNSNANSKNNILLLDELDIVVDEVDMSNFDYACDHNDTSCDNSGNYSIKRAKRERLIRAHSGLYKNANPFLRNTNFRQNEDRIIDLVFAENYKRTRRTSGHNICVNSNTNKNTNNSSNSQDNPKSKNDKSTSIVQDAVSGVWFDVDKLVRKFGDVNESNIDENIFEFVSSSVELKELFERMLTLEDGTHGTSAIGAAIVNSEAEGSVTTKTTTDTNSNSTKNTKAKRNRKTIRDRFEDINDKSATTNKFEKIHYRFILDLLKYRILGKYGGFFVDIDSLLLNNQGSGFKQIVTELETFHNELRRKKIEKYAFRRGVFDNDDSKSNNNRNSDSSGQDAASNDDLVPNSINENDEVVFASCQNFREVRQIHRPPPLAELLKSYSNISEHYAVDMFTPFFFDENSSERNMKNIVAHDKMDGSNFSNNDGNMNIGKLFPTLSRFSMPLMTKAVRASLTDTMTRYRNRKSDINTDNSKSKSNSRRYCTDASTAMLFSSLSPTKKSRSSNTITPKSSKSFFRLAYENARNKLFHEYVIAAYTNYKNNNTSEFSSNRSSSSGFVSTIYDVDFLGDAFFNKQAEVAPRAVQCFSSATATFPFGFDTDYTRQLFSRSNQKKNRKSNDENSLIPPAIKPQIDAIMADHEGEEKEELLLKRAGKSNSNGKNDIRSSNRSSKSGNSNSSSIDDTNDNTFHSKVINASYDRLVNNEYNSRNKGTALFDMVDENSRSSLHQSLHALGKTLSKDMRFINSSMT